MTAAILSTKTKRFFDLAVGSELFEGQKIKDFQEKKAIVWNSRMRENKSKPKT